MTQPNSRPRRTNKRSRCSSRISTAERPGWRSWSNGLGTSRNSRQHLAARVPGQVVGPALGFRCPVAGRPTPGFEELRIFLHSRDPPRCTPPFHPSQIPPTAPPSAPPQKQFPSSRSPSLSILIFRDNELHRADVSYLSRIELHALVRLQCLYLLVMPSLEPNFQTNPSGNGDTQRCT